MALPSPRAITHPARRWGASDVAVVLAAAAIVPRWSKWLNDRQTIKQTVAKTDADQLAEEWTFYRPTSATHLAQGFGTVFAYLALLDTIVARKAVDQTSRFFVLHALANLAITIAAAPDAARSLLHPMQDGCGKMSILPVYLIAGLFAYHLSVFSNVPKDEWIHHLVFGGGIAGPGLINPASPIGNALAFFICGLPGGIDYGMLAAVKEGLLSSDREKQINTKLNVWCRSPGLTMVAYAIFVGWRYYKPAPMSGKAAFVVAALAFLNGQYYMQRVVANTAIKVGAPSC